MGGTILVLSGGGSSTAGEKEWERDMIVELRKNSLDERPDEGVYKS